MRKIRGLLCVLVLSLIIPAISISEVPLFTSTFIGSPFKSGEGMFATHIAQAGDVNGDGYGDILVNGYFSRNTTTSKGAYLYLGSSGGIVAENPKPVFPSIDPSFIAPAGDVDSDGYDDILVGGSPWKTCLYRGGPQGVEQHPAWVPDQNYFIGNYFAPAGDVNGDGYADVVVSGAAIWQGNFHGTGDVYLFLGSGLGPSTTPASVLSFEWDYASGFSSADVNHDGYSDLVVFAHRGPHDGESQHKALSLYYGGPNGYQSEPAWAPDEKIFPLNCSISLGDVNGDGNLDLLVGVPWWGPEPDNYPEEGKVFLFYGNGKTFSKEADWSLRSESRLSMFGATVAVADVNGDGYGDALIGGRKLFEFNGMGDEGIFFFPGSREGLATKPAWVERENRYGVVMAAVGDVNGDGRADFASTLVVNGPNSEIFGVKVYYDFKETEKNNFLLVPPLCFLETLGAER